MALVLGTLEGVLIAPGMDLEGEEEDEDEADAGVDGSLLSTMTLRSCRLASPRVLMGDDVTVDASVTCPA